MKTSVSTSFLPTIAPQTHDDHYLPEDFVARGLASREEAKASCIYFSSNDVMASLEQKLSKAEASNNL
jgi:hypothetical protein